MSGLQVQGESSREREIDRERESSREREIDRERESSRDSDSDKEISRERESESNRERAVEKEIEEETDSDKSESIDIDSPEFESLPLEQRVLLLVTGIVQNVGGINDDEELVEIYTGQLADEISTHHDGITNECLNVAFIGKVPELFSYLFEAWIQQSEALPAEVRQVNVDKLFEYIQENPSYTPQQAKVFFVEALIWCCEKGYLQAVSNILFKKSFYEKDGEQKVRYDKRERGLGLNSLIFNTINRRIDFSSLLSIFPSLVLI